MPPSNNLTASRNSIQPSLGPPSSCKRRFPRVSSSLVLWAFLLLLVLTVTLLVFSVEIRTPTSIITVRKGVIEIIQSLGSHQGLKLLVWRDNESVIHSVFANYSLWYFGLAIGSTCMYLLCHRAKGTVQELNWAILRKILHAKKSAALGQVLWGMTFAALIAVVLSSQFQVRVIHKSGTYGLWAGGIQWIIGTTISQSDGLRIVISERLPINLICAEFALSSHSGTIPTYIPLAFTAASLVMYHLLGSRRAVNVHNERQLCTQCGYDLRCSERRCPECGQIRSSGE